jgi:polysaccharide biosynthesis/export protein
MMPRLHKAMRWCVLLCPLLLVVSLCIMPQPVVAMAEKASSAPASIPGPETKAPPDGTIKDEFIIGPGDVLNIFVWKEQDLSRSIPVRPDGKISLPLVNDVQASGLTALQLKELLTEKFGKFVAQPNITVTVETINSQKVVIVGDITGGGSRPLIGPMRIMDILATANFTPFAKKTQIQVLRNENGKQQKFKFNYKEYLKGKNLDQNILLKNGDTIVVP